MVEELLLKAESETTRTGSRIVTDPGVGERVDGFDL